MLLLLFLISLFLNSPLGCRWWLLTGESVPGLIVGSLVLLLALPSLDKGVILFYCMSIVLIFLDVANVASLNYWVSLSLRDASNLASCRIIEVFVWCLDKLWLNWANHLSACCLWNGLCLPLGAAIGSETFLFILWSSVKYIWLLVSGSLWFYTIWDRLPSSYLGPKLSINLSRLLFFSNEGINKPVLLPG